MEEVSMRKHWIIASILIMTMISTGCAAARSAPVQFTEPSIIEAPAEGRVQYDAVESFEAPQAENAVEIQTGSSITERLVIRNADLTIVVTDPAKSAQRIGQMAETMGGFVVSSNIYQTTYDSGIRADRANITIRVPADRLDEVLEDVKDDAVEVRNESISGQDVTQEYTDLQSQLRNLEAAEEELINIMDRAIDAEDVLDVFEHLRQVRNEIEVIKGRIQYFEESARLSAVSVDLIADAAAQPLQIGRWQPEGTAKAAVEALFEALRFLGDAAIWVGICVLPIGLLFGIPGWLVFRAIRRRRRRAGTENSAEKAE
jgi:hypothetical protein